MFRKSYITVLLLIVLIFFAGCINEPSKISLDSQTQVQSKTYIDLGADGISELAIIKFSPLSTASEGQKLSIERTILISPNSFDAEIEFKDATQENIKSITSDIRSNAESTKSKCQLVRDICIDEGTCIKACTSSICQRSQDSGIGMLIYDFVQHEKKFFLYLTELESISNSIDPFSDSKKIGNALAGTYIELEVLKMHPAKNYILCEYNPNTLYDFISKNKISVKSHEFSALVVSEIKGFGLKDPIELSIKDILPSSVTSKYLDLKVSKFDSFIRDIPPYIEFFPRKVSESGIISASYQIKLSDSFSLKSAEEWKNTEISMQVFSNDSQYTEALLSIIMQIFNFVYSITKLFAFSITFSMFAIMAVFSLLAEIIKLAYHLGTGTLTGTSLRDSILKSFGKAKSNPIKRILIGILLLLFAIGLEILYPIQTPKELTFMQIIASLQENPIAFIVVSFAIFGFTIAGDIVGELLKGLIAGKQFYKNVLEATPKINKLKLERLKQIIADAKKELEKYSSKGVNTSEELSKLSSIPVSVLEANIESEDPITMANKLDAYISMASESTEIIKQKDEEASKSWELWKSTISKELSQKDSVDINNIFEIPSQLKAWAASKYIEESKEQDLSVEGNIIRKVILTPEEKARKLASNFVDSNLFKAILILKDGSTIAYSCSLPRKTLIGNMLLTMLSGSMTIAKQFKTEHTIYIMSKLGANLIGMRSEGRYQILFIGQEENLSQIENLIGKIVKV